MLDADPLGPGGLAEFAQKLRAGAITSEAATCVYLARIEALDGRLGAYQHVAPEQALASARAMDALLAAGTDLGPLMGLPIGIKDLYSVEGMPTTVPAPKWTSAT
jgi:aspartyl-tRNA(Asn)/glutamyl-tRNA(Gln) amidotransferase subunit A